MEIRTSEEARKNIEDFANAYLEKLQEKKRLDQEIKDLKDEFKEEGVPVGIVTSAINKIKADKKKNDSQKFEEDTIREWLETNDNIDNQIGMLGAK